MEKSNQKKCNANNILKWRNEDYTKESITVCQLITATSKILG